ncbi:hypothetical protein PSECIP111951_01088 [Pseudoalteromonas holothuriae]|uniref:Uncharacterized protein n=1 Tax=Pseudoalteromonas holothuriae TaxID=2963714 RepID=A0A9W4QWV4_9GAMM|nr:MULTISPECIES: hypothetical protein [unclassified Pseudoalteromonas]CAH9054683.1 hypothetical protein PSECIP111951_01088 [Pseudoalteromonas sp. CIP111951]CAH9057375.1 hypothetical protein PSECIP111854_01984 [Pseudoalteromonas sp. CIP111854]
MAAVHKVDLSLFKCPQLFVQFKWHLRQAQQQTTKVQFYYLTEQDISDIVRYLEQHRFIFSHHQGIAPFLEVNTNHV